MAVDDGWCGPVFFASCTMRARGMVIETLAASPLVASAPPPE